MSKFLDLRKKIDLIFYLFFFLNLFGNSLYVLTCMFVHRVLKSFRCNFRNKHCMRVTNRKSMKVNFATLCIGEKTILQIKNLLPVFLFPAETLRFGSSLAGYQWVSWCGRRVGDCLGARGQLELGLYHWALLPPSPHRWFEFDWQVLSASQPAASQPSQMAEPKYDFLRQRFKARRLAPATISLFVPAVFKQELPLCNAGSAPAAPCAAPVGKWDGLWLFVPLLPPSSRPQREEFSVLLDSV